MKTHKTTVLTLERIAASGVCSAHLQYTDLLPATISSDPVQNLELAEALTTHPRSEAGYGDVEFLVWMFGFKYGRDTNNVLCNYPDDDYFPRRSKDNNIQDAAGLDAFIVAQWLAWIADKLLTEQGK